jgi:hypothetical protein
VVVGSQPVPNNELGSQKIEKGKGTHITISSAPRMQSSTETEARQCIENFQTTQHACKDLEQHVDHTLLTDFAATQQQAIFSFTVFTSDN